MSKEAFLSELKMQLGPSFSVEGRDGDFPGQLRVQAGIRVVAAATVDGRTVEFAVGSVVPHMAREFKHKIREAVEGVGLPEPHGFVKIPVKLYHELRYVVLADPKRYALFDHLFRETV